MNDISEFVGKVFCEDALSLCARLPDASIDAIISDFPYNTTANEWESGIALSDAFASEVWRVTKKNAAVITTASQPFTALLTVKWLWAFSHEWIWEKTRPTGYLNANIAPMKLHESILVFCKGTPLYNPEMTEGEPYRATSGAVGGHVRDKSVGGYETVNDGTRYPTSVLHFPSVNGFHPSEKPLDLYRYLIRTYTQENGIVLDMFCGSGTTCAAAMVEKRRYIGNDKERSYAEYATERLKTDFASRKQAPGKPLSDLPLFAGLE